MAVHAGDYLATAETHSAVVLFVGDRAYKFKKPVDLGFLDFSTRERRQEMCRREVELNRRIAPDVYLGTADVVGPDGLPCEHLVVMRRMPTQRRLSTLVRAGSDVEDAVRHIARQVAVFHSAARRDAEVGVEGSREAIRRRWTDSFHQVRSLTHRVVAHDVLDDIELLTYEFLDGRDPLFAGRVAAGRIVDGHGDLLADDIFCLDDGPRILDCIEFNDQLRWLDQLDDAAFLAMDLEYLSAPELARRFLDWYLEYAGDPAPMALRHHFIAYRAFVRCKVACLRYEQGDESARTAAVRHAELTLAHLRAGSVALILVGGLPGTGKSTLSGALADVLGAAVVSSDRVRKELAGIPPETSATAPFGEGIYRPEWTDRAYDEILHRADDLLGQGESVILDASWTSERHRGLARALGSRTHSRLVELRCEAAAAETLDRLRRRDESASDADEHIARAMAARADPWPQALTVRTDGSLQSSVADAVSAARLA